MCGTLNSSNFPLQSGGLLFIYVSTTALTRTSRGCSLATVMIPSTVSKSSKNCFGTAIYNWHSLLEYLDDYDTDGLNMNIE